MTDTLPAHWRDARHDGAPSPAPGRAGWLIAGGLALGVTAALLLPRRNDDSAGQKGLSRHARAALEIAGEVGLAIAVRALSNAGHDQPHGDALADAPAPIPPPAGHGVFDTISARFPALDGPALSRSLGVLTKLWDRRKSR